MRKERGLHTSSLLTYFFLFSSLLVNNKFLRPSKSETITTSEISASNVSFHKFSFLSISIYPFNISSFTVIRQCRRQSEIEKIQKQYRYVPSVGLQKT